jgi:hypothetical protein
MVKFTRLLANLLEQSSTTRVLKAESVDALSFLFQLEDLWRQAPSMCYFIAQLLENFSQSVALLRNFVSARDFIARSSSQIIFAVAAFVWKYHQTLLLLSKWVVVTILNGVRMAIGWCLQKVYNFVETILTFIFFPLILGIRFAVMVQERLAMEGKMAKVTPPLQPVEIDMDSRLDKLEAILKAVVNKGETLESVIPGSVMFKADKWPEHLVGIKNRDGVHIGFGFFLVHAGNWVLMSAKHVIEDINMGSIYNGGKRAIKIENKRVYCSFELDFAGIIMENNDASLMGVKKVKIDKTRSAGTSLSLYGMYRGQLVVSRGSLEGPTGEALKFKHSCSSQPGFCGSPLITGDNKVIGIHVSTDNFQYNYAVSLDLLVETLETDTVTTEKSMFTNDEDLELSGRNRRFMIYDNESGEYVEYGVKLSKKAWRATLQDKVNAFRSTAEYGSWADDQRDELPDIDDLRAMMRESIDKLDVAMIDPTDFLGEKENSSQTLSPAPLTSVTRSTTTGLVTPDKKETKRAKRRAQRQRKKLAKETLPLLEDSGAVLKEVKESTISPLTVNSQVSPVLKTGDGPKEAPKPLGTPSPTMQGVIKQVVSPVGARSVKSSKPLPKMVNTLKLGRLVGVWKEKLSGVYDVEPLQKHLETVTDVGMPVTPRLIDLVWEVTTVHCRLLDLETMKETCSLYTFLST